MHRLRFLLQARPVHIKNFKMQRDRREAPRNKTKSPFELFESKSGEIPARRDRQDCRGASERCFCDTPGGIAALFRVRDVATMAMALTLKPMCRHSFCRRCDACRDCDMPDGTKYWIQNKALARGT